MAQLNVILGSIMRDIIMAQHEANLYSYALREQYGRDGKVKDYQLPGAVLGDMEMELNYGVVSLSDNNEQYAIRYEKFNKFLRELAQNIAKKALDIITDYVSINAIQTPQGSKFLEKLEKRGETYKEYLRYIFNAIISNYDGTIYELIDRKDGTPNEEEIINRFSDAITRCVINDTEATKTLFTDPDGNARKIMSQRVKAEITALVPKMCKNRKFKRTKSFPMLNVAVTSDELSTMPKESIHTCKLKFTPTAFNVRTEDDELSLPVQNIEDIIK